MFALVRLSGEMQKSYYVVLGPEATATPAEFKAAFRPRAGKVDPDLFGIHHFYLTIRFRLTDTEPDHERHQT
jgi:hypothetical protein